MSSQPQTVHITSDEYLVKERQAQHKSEYLAGNIIAMAGASQAHNQIVANVLTEINSQFKQRPCWVYANDMRVKVSATGLYTYPDIVAGCGEYHFADEQQDTLLNPMVIIEVLSPSTANYDRGDKFKHYRQLESLQEYILIAQDQCHIEHYVRQSLGQWLLSEQTHLSDTLELPAIQCYLTLFDVYDKVK